MSYSKPNQGNPLEKIAKAYIGMLQTKPLLTKALTSACTSGIGSILSQLIGGGLGPGGRFSYRTILAYFLTGLLFIGPTMHYFYIWLEKVVPRKQKYSSILRLLLDRFIFAPPWLVAYFYILSILEGQGSAAAIQKIQEVYWTVLKMNWRVWTIFQYINVNYVPQQYRVLFASVVALGWNIYVAGARK